MTNYLNLHGDSNVKCYEIHDNYIDIIFYKTPSIYRYSNKISGSYVVKELKRLALQGYGLNEYINRYVKKNYECKIPLN